jgi:hypothetical protein
VVRRCRAALLIFVAATVTDAGFSRSAAEAVIVAALLAAAVLLGIPLDVAAHRRESAALSTPT